MILLMMFFFKILKFQVKETDQSGDGIESVLNKVESLITQGNLREAADVLENGVNGSKATELDILEEVIKMEEQSEEIKKMKAAVQYLMKEMRK